MTTSNVPITGGSGYDILTDQKTIATTTGQVEYMALADGTAGSNNVATIDSNQGLRTYSGSTLVIDQTPTVSSGSAYAAGDAVGGLLTFANAALYSGGSGFISAVRIDDLGQQMATLELVLFDQSFTASSDNAAFAPSDADLANAVADLPIYSWYNFSTNAVGMASNLWIPFTCSGGTSLYGQLLTRGTPTYTSTSDIKVRLTVYRI